MWGMDGRGHRGGLRLLLLALVATGGCDASPPQPAPAQTRPPERAALQRERVVSLSPLATRFAMALGAERALVAVDEVSGRLPGLEALPVARPESAADHAPDLVLLPPEAGDEPAPGAIDPGEAKWVVFAPHELEEVFALTRTLGARLVGAVEAQRFEARVARPLAAVGGASFGRTRPRVVAVVDLDPVVIAGGHSFETDLIEIAGGRSVTHASGEPRQRVGPGDWSVLAPDLIWVLGPEPLSPEERSAALGHLPVEVPIAFFPVDAATFWLAEDPTEAARRLRALIEPLSAERELSPGAAARSAS